MQHDALCLKSVPIPVCVVTPFGKHPLRPGQIVEQRCSAGVIAELTSGHEEGQRTTVRVGDGVKLRVHAALGATNEPYEIPF
jgi:hypothetical protein